MKCFIEFGPLTIVMIVAIIMTCLYVKHKKRAIKFQIMLDELSHHESHQSIILNETRAFSKRIFEELVSNWEYFNSKHPDELPLLAIEQINLFVTGHNEDIERNHENLVGARELIISYNELYEDRIKKYIERSV
jgi:hypothetical protein